MMNLDEDWGQDKENDMGLGRQARHVVEGLEYQAGKKLFSDDSDIGFHANLHI